MEQVQVVDSGALGAVAATLIAEWEGRARRKFVDAEHEHDPMGRRLIEHGAFCYFNCAQQLKEAVRADASLPP